MTLQQNFLFLSPQTIRVLLIVVLFSQMATIAVASLDFLPQGTTILSQETEEPKPAEGENAFDFLEESEFLMVDLPVCIFLTEERLNTLYKEVSFFEETNTLDSPPPEVA